MQQRVNVCTELRQLASNDETFLSRVITGDLAPCDFYLFPKMKLKLKGRRFDTTEEIQAETQKVLDTLTERTSVYIRAGTTSRVTAADRPYGKFYDFYSVSLETLGSTHVFSELTLGPCFSMLLVERKTSALCCDDIDTVARHGMRKAKKFAASDSRLSAAKKQTCALSPRSKHTVAQLFAYDSVPYVFTNLE
jgi:hypothetical protein